MFTIIELSYQSIMVSTNIKYNLSVIHNISRTKKGFYFIGIMKLGFLKSFVP